MKKVRFETPTTTTTPKNKISEIALMVDIHKQWKSAILDYKTKGIIPFELSKDVFSLVEYSRMLKDLCDSFYIERYNSFSEVWEHHVIYKHKSTEPQHIYNKYCKFRVNIEQTLKL